MEIKKIGLYRKVEWESSYVLEPSRRDEHMGKWDPPNSRRQSPIRQSELGIESRSRWPPSRRTKCAMNGVDPPLPTSYAPETDSEEEPNL